jgi:hypothetical protein
MSDLEDRLAAWNPVRAEDMLQASSSADAARLLHRILNQSATSRPRRRADRPSWRARVWIATAATAATAAVAIAGIVFTLPSSPNQAGAPPVNSFERGPSMGVASNAAELVDYDTRSAALAPMFMPGPQDWTYFEVYNGLNSINGPSAVGDLQTWQQVGTLRNASSWQHGTVTYGVGGGPGAQLGGWPGSTNWTNMYQYLASLPAEPTALRKIILANNHGDPVAAFTAIENLFGNFAIPARFQAELYAVLVSLPGVTFTRHAVDAAGRPGAGLYIVQDYHSDAQDTVRALNEVIVNPRTYVYMGTLFIEAPGHLSDSTLLAYPGSGTIIESGAILNSGIVSQPGQLP